MITPGEIRKKAVKYYLKFLRSGLSGENFFPLEIPANRGKSTDPFLERTKGLAALVQKSKDRQGTGYSLDFKEVKTRDKGIQSVVSRIYFSTEEDYLRFIGKYTEFRNFCSSVTLIGSSLPQLKTWIHTHPSLVIKYEADWPALLAVCRYFLEHPAPGLYIRELPVNVHTKFIEEHQAVLKKLLDFLLPAAAVNTRATAFARRYKLKIPATLFRLRFLDPAHSLQDMEELAVPLASLRQLKLSVRTVIIIENLMTFLTFPRVKDGLAIWGKGFKAHKLKEVAWLHHKHLYYWGDIDPPGFEILSAVRSHFSHTISLMMDFAAYHAFSDWAVPLTGSRKLSELCLTQEELSLYTYLLEHPEQARLEQERITQEYVVQVVQKIIL